MLKSNDAQGGTEMADTVTAEEKRQIYRRAASELDALLENGGLDAVAALSTFVSVLHAALPQASWTGFYRVVAPRLLRVGPYQGPVGCLEIPFERGVCGAAAREARSQIVADVHAFPGHISCDAHARSEIVVPITDRAGAVAAVLDVDSHRLGAFDEVDRVELESLVLKLRPYLDAGVAEATP